MKQHNRKTYELICHVGSLVKAERGSYQLKKRIYTGGMGIVWEAESTTDARRVIVKEPLINKDQDQIKIERLHIEAAVLRTINDERGEVGSDEGQQIIRRGVVRYLDQLDDSSHPFLVLELIDGPLMSQEYRGVSSPETTAVRQVLSLLRVVQAIHSRGVIHRDISPNNIILNHSRGLVLIDFGTSTISHGPISARSSRSGRVVFKRGFSAPELLDGLSGQFSDIFSVGATMYFLLTSRNPGDFMSGPRSAVTRTARSLNPDISTALSELVGVALSPQPGKRFQSAAEMIDALEMQVLPRKKLAPTVSVGGTICELTPDFVEVGRKHTCDTECRSLGHKTPIQIRIADAKEYIEKHHARIWVTSSGQCSIEDLHSVNGTWIKRGNEEFRRLKPVAQEELHDKDIVALAYSRARGPYVALVFHDQ